MNQPNINIETLTPWLEYKFSRSSGPGGQNVNKVNTRVTLLFDFEQCDVFSDDQKSKIRSRCLNRLSADGRLAISSQMKRTQLENRAAAEEILTKILQMALAVQKKRRPTRPSRASRERRLQNKKQRGEIKKLRQSRPPTD